jgi:hypothetical protein
MNVYGTLLGGSVGGGGGKGKILRGEKDRSTLHTNGKGE